MPLVALQARKLGVRVEVRCANDLPYVLCDRTMVEQVLLNLSRNGMQAMQDDTPDKTLTLLVRTCSPRPRPAVDGVCGGRPRTWHCRRFG
jgi:two-component system sensor histidine kinase DctS